VSRRVWQVAAGDPGRFYTTLFRDHDIMFIGPGDPGEFDDAVYRREVERGLLTLNKMGGLKSFRFGPKPDDLVFMREAHKVIALGLIPDEARPEHGYLWDDTFDDVHGWDLQHTRRVIWQEQLEGDIRQLQANSKLLFKDRKSIPSFTSVSDSKVLNPISHLFDKCKVRPLRKRPPPIPKPLELDELGAELFSKGLPNESVDKVLVAIQRQRRMARWYAECGRKTHRPTEHEVVAHMVLPLMLALGWSEQLLAVEWHKIDLAVFCATPTTEETCPLICEAKVIGHGLQDTYGQAKKYTERLRLTACNKIMLTDGIRIYLYERGDTEWPDSASGYFNVKKIRTNHIAPGDTNAVDTLMALTPSRVLRPLIK